MKKYTKPEFAQKIRKKYPGSYDDLSDDKLVELWLKKYPADKEKINSEEGSVFNLFFNLFFIVLIGGGIFLGLQFVISYFKGSGNSEHHTSAITAIDSSSSSNLSSSEESISNNISETQDITDDQSTGSEKLKNSYIDPSISIRIDTNKIIKLFKFNDSYIKKIKIILSDPQEDPENKNGTYCDDQELTCKYCSNIFYMNKEYTSINNTLSKFFFNPLYAWAIVVQYSISEEMRDLFRNDVINYCNLYFSGNKYTCELADSKKEFCSLKCEDNYKWRR
jgi:hypothetical protein